MPDLIHPVVLCGGSGTRLWPLSRKAFPKQFVPLIDDKSLLQLTLERLALLNRDVQVVNGIQHFTLLVDGIEVRTQAGLPGLHNVENAVAAAALAHSVPMRVPHRSLAFCRQITTKKATITFCVM